MFGFLKRTKSLPPAELSPEADAFLASAITEFNEKSERLTTSWNFSSFEEWGYDQYSGELALKLADGRRVIADGQILGSYSQKDRTWEWAWNNPHVEAGVAEASREVRKVGEQLAIAYLLQGVLPVPDEIFVSYLCAIGVKATASTGIFRGAAGSVDVMILVRNVRYA